MSKMMGLLLVWEKPGPNPSSVAFALANATGARATAVRDRQWSLTEWLTDGFASLLFDEMGYAYLLIHWSVGVFCGTESDSRLAADAVEFAAISLAQELSPVFGYVTTYSTQLEQDWLQNNVFVPLLAGDDELLVSPLYHIIIAHDSVPIGQDSTALWESDCYNVLRVSHSRNPLEP